MIRIIQPVIASIMIFVLDMYALSKGIDGTCLIASVTLIAGLGGYSLKSAIECFRKARSGD